MSVCANIALKAGITTDANFIEEYWEIDIIDLQGFKGAINEAINKLQLPGIAVYGAAARNFLKSGGKIIIKRSYSDTPGDAVKVPITEEDMNDLGKLAEKILKLAV